MKSEKFVSLGGGHGLAATLTALRDLTSQLTAIVTVADNGGSSGRLRQEFDRLPPGDLRMALAALCSDDDWGRGWAEVLQYRFTNLGTLQNHALGNLLLMALWEMDGDPIAGIDQVGKLLRIVGRVLPMSITPLDIEATLAPSPDSAVLEVVRGQVEVAKAHGTFKSLRLIPENPRATPESLSAIADADWITLGPGSWFSSVMPHILLKEQSRAIVESKAKKILVFNLPEPKDFDEFAGSSLEEHLEFLLEHEPDLRLDYAIADLSAISYNSNLQVMVEGLGGRLLIDDLAATKGGTQHSVEKLRAVFSQITRFSSDK